MMFKVTSINNIYPDNHKPSFIGKALSRVVTAIRWLWSHLFGKSASSEEGASKCISGYKIGEDGFYWPVDNPGQGQPLGSGSCSGAAPVFGG